MHFRPVCKGSWTLLRSARPGAGDSTRRVAPAEQCLADRNFKHALGALGDRTFLDAEVVAHDHGADVALFEIEREAVRAVFEGDHLTGHAARETGDAGDAVADLDNGADLVDDQLRAAVIGELRLDQGGHLVCADLHSGLGAICE